MITPSDIENKEFKRVKKGFDPDEVDEFLKINSESTVYETLAAAKQLMNDIAASAERRAEILLKNAELEADMITREAKENISRYTEEGNRLMSRVDVLRERYRSLLKEELDRMNSVENDFFSEFRNDFMPASIQDLPENDVKIAPAREAADSRTKVAEEKVDLTKTMVITKG